MKTVGEIITAKIVGEIITQGERREGRAAVPWQA